MGKELLSLIIESFGRSAKEFAGDIGVHLNTVNRWLSGDSKPCPNNQGIIRAKFKKQIAKIYR